MTASALSEAHDWTGKWWRPDHPEEKVPGVLSFVPDIGLTLRLIGGWDYAVTQPGGNGSIIVTDEFQQWPVVLGEGDGEFLTLIGLTVANAKSFGATGLFGPPDKLELRASTALVGVHMDDPHEAAFIAASADVEDLTVWSRRSGIRQKSKFDSALDEVSGEIQLTRMSPLSAVAGPLTVELSHYSWWPFAEHSRSPTLSRVRESEMVRFKRHEPQQLEYWIELLSGMADLMSLSTLRPCGLISARVYLPPMPERWPAKHPMRDQPHEIAVYMRRVVEPHPDDKGLELRNYVLTLDDLPFEQLMPRWLEVGDTFAAAQSMILGLRYIRSGYIETRVVTAVSAAESMHRALDPSPPIPPQEFKQLRKLALSAVPTERKAWLAERLTVHSSGVPHSGVARWSPALLRT